MAERTPAEKFLANWAKDYVEADPEDRLPMDATVERCLSDAELAACQKTRWWRQPRAMSLRTLARR